MDHYAGIDVSLECSSVCVVDANGKIVREAKVASEPEALIGWFGSLGFGPARIGLEAGMLSQWLYAAMKQADLAVELLETRHVYEAFKSMPVIACAIDDPSRFTSSKQVGPYLGLTPKKYQSGETDYTGRISKHGDASVREALYEAAHIMLTKPIKGCSELKSWAMRIARRAGINKAKVALARKLAVIMLRMLKDNVPFNPAAKAATA